MKPINCLKHFGVVLLFATGPVHAANCNGSQTSDVTQCASEDFHKIDTQLNKAYNRYRARLSESQKKQLKEAQLAWIRFRDLSCDFESSGVEGGSAYPMIRDHCLVTKTGIRLREIQALEKCEEGDLSCPALKTK
jgi:uncharacterized protein YecT (DUF1311 family)